MQRSPWRESGVGVLLVIGVVVTVAWVYTVAPAQAATLERLVHLPDLCAPWRAYVQEHLHRRG